jgi:pimeloyl-ACP methyl ester carboxylesterase
VIGGAVPALLALLIAAPGAVLGQGTSAVEGAETSAARELVGEWGGMLERGGTTAEVRLSLRPDGDGLSGTFDWTGLGYQGAELIGVVLEDGLPSFSIPMPLGALVLRCTSLGDVIEGHLIEVTRRANEWVRLPPEGSFRLQRVQAVPPPYSVEPLRIESGDTSLAGAVYLPRGEGPFPGVVFIHGSGDSDRSDGAFFADRFARAGIATLVYDKRGVGESTGDWRSGGYQELAADAHAALTVLGKRARVDPDRVGYVVRSEGGWVGPLAVERGGAAFFAAISAPTVSVAEEDIDHYRVALREAGFDEEAMAKAFALLRARHDVIAGVADGEGLTARVEAVRGLPWFGVLGWEAAESADDVFRSRTIRFDPASHLKTLGVPSLWLYGTDDTVIPAGESVARLMALQISPRPAIMILPGADHALARSDYPRLPAGVARSAEVLSEWIRQIPSLR